MQAMTACPRINAQRAFTLIELIAVMIIIGVLAVAAIPRFFDRKTFEERGFYDQVISTIRYAQKPAIAQHWFVCVTFPTTSTMTLTFGDTSACSGNILASPSGIPYPVDGRGSVFNPLPAAFSFDCLGRPRTGGGGTCGDGGASARQTIQIQNMPIITVEQDTGYVH